MVTGAVSAEEPILERIEWVDIWGTDANKDGLHRVLLVGDSITRGYFWRGHSPIREYPILPPSSILRTG